MVRRRRGAVLFLACGLSAVLCTATGSRAGINPFSAESFKSAREEQQRVEEYHRQIRQFKRTGGEEGSRGLRGIIAGSDVPQKSRDEAIVALGSLRRPEDVAFLFDWPLRHRAEEARRYGEPEYTALAAIATIGGEEACRLLNGHFTEALQADSYKMNFGKFAAILAKARCLTPGELVDLARAASRDRWADHSLTMSALEYLAQAGDAQAQATMQKLEAISKTFWGAKSFPLEGVSQVLHDPEVHWSRKVRLMDIVTMYQKGSKEELFDLYFDLAVQLVTERPDHRFAKSRFSHWADMLTSRHRFNTSVWTRTDAVTYFEENRRRYRQELDAAAFKHMDEIITEALRWQSYNLERGRRSLDSEKRIEERAALDGQPRREPIFASFGSRLRDTELFVFDEQLRWYGVGRLDLFLAGVVQGSAVGADETQVVLLRQMALRALSIEQAGNVQGTAAASVLMPLPAEVVFEGLKPEWSPQTGDFSEAFTPGQEKLVVMRLLREGPASCWVNVGPGSAGGEKRAFRFREERLPAGSFVVLLLETSTGRIPVYLSSAGETFSRGYRLLPDGSQEQFAVEESDSESVRRRFVAARLVLERYEQETLAAAGGASGVRKFRESLLQLPDGSVGKP